jgi:Pyruvate/2-oxoacid:ferredoxin oxidoreductase delta subunit
MKNIIDDNKQTELKAEKKVPAYKTNLWVPHKNGLGIKNWIIDHTSAHQYSWKFYLGVFRTIVNGSKLMKYPVLGKIYKTLMMFGNENQHTSATVYNLNVDVSEEGESVVLPMDLIKDTINQASYIASINKCLCRDAQDCKDYPKEVCCLFLSKAGKRVVSHGVAYEISKEDALKRVDEAAKLGLIGQALWVEVEQFIWGFANDEMENFLEICFCCPCCCVGFNLSRNASPDVKERFRPTGWTAVIEEDKCIGCGDCCPDGLCPQESISIVDGKAVVVEDCCVGCGICKTKCQHAAIKIRQTKPMLGSMREYFLKEGGLDLKI